MTRLIFLFTLHSFLVLVFLSASSLTAEVGEYCQDESFSATCQQNQVILMESARYGRVKIGRCVKRNLGYLGCSFDVLRFVDSRCSGQTTCELSIMDASLREFGPCPKDVTWHLDSSYNCVDVIVANNYDCQTKKHVTATTQSGYLSSSFASKTSVGSSSCPWKLQVQQGQKLNISLLNFVSATHQSVSSFMVGGVAGAFTVPASKSTPELCYDVAVVREGSLKRSITACSSEQRMRSVYLSTGSTVHVEFSVRNVLSNPMPTPSVQFLIYYEAVGCPSFITPVGMTVTSQPDKESRKLRCNTSGEMWTLSCSGNKWTGNIGNCSNVANHVWNGDDFFGQPGFPFGILIVVAVGVALGVFLGGTLLLLASMLMRRQRLSQRDVYGENVGSEEFKSPDEVDYSMNTNSTKHNIVQECFPKEFIAGSTECGAGFDVDYAVNGLGRERGEELDRTHRGHHHLHHHQTNPRILYHVYESPQLT